MVNPMDLSGRRVLITGASSGLGRAASVLLSNLGAELILVARNEERLLETRALTENANHQISCFDLSQTDAIPEWMKSLTGAHGPLSGLVHCAGVHTTRPLRMMSTANLESLMSVNVSAALQLARGFRQRPVRAESGSVVFLASVMGIVGQAGVSAYCASKGALIALARSLAMELAGEQIRVNCVAPGQVRTEMSERMEQSLPEEHVARIAAMHPLGIGEPRDVANSIAFLLADTGRWITGSTLTVDGGYTAH